MTPSPKPSDVDLGRVSTLLGQPGGSGSTGHAGALSGLSGTLANYADIPADPLAALTNVSEPRGQGLNDQQPAGIARRRPGPVERRERFRAAGILHVPRMSAPRDSGRVLDHRDSVSRVTKDKSQRARRQTVANINTPTAQPRSPTMEAAAKMVQQLTLRILPRKPHHLFGSSGSRHPIPSNESTEKNPVEWEDSRLQYSTFVLEADRGVLLTKSYYDMHVGLCQPLLVQTEDSDADDESEIR